MVFMPTVTQIIRNTKQPKGGYIPARWLNKHEFNQSASDRTYDENIKPQIIGTVVDYLTRYCLIHPKDEKQIDEAFHICGMGAEIIDDVWGFKQHILKMRTFDEDETVFLDDETIKHAVQLIHYDVIYRTGSSEFAPTSDELKPDDDTIKSIRQSVERAMYFFSKMRTPIDSEIVFDGGFNDYVTNGDGDFLANDTIWDMKVSKYPPNKDHTLQLAMYYILAQASGQYKYTHIQRLGIYNPRLHTCYYINVKDIPKDTWQTIKYDIMQY